MTIEILYYETETGKEPYFEWRNSLKDMKTGARIDRRLERVEEGNFGDHGPIKGRDSNGLFELRFHFGAGPRIYYGMEDEKTVVILNGGMKGSQDKDIERAKKYWKDQCSKGDLKQRNLEETIA